MPFPSNIGTKRDTQADAWQAARALAGQIKTQAMDLRAAAQAGAISAKFVIDIATNLADAKELFARSRAVPGIGAYVQQQIDNPTIDIATEFNSMIAAIDATVGWIKTNFPQDGSGFLLAIQFTQAGRFTYRTLSVGQTAGLRTQLTALIELID